MTDDIAQWYEGEIESHVPALLQEIGVTMIADYNLRVGHQRDFFKLDALGKDRASDIVVAEFKCVQDKGVIGQLLSYCHLVEETAHSIGIHKKVRGIVASNHVEASWVPIARELTASGVRTIDIFAIIRNPDTGAPKLVSAETVGTLRNKGGQVEKRAALINSLRAAFGDRNRSE